VSNEAIAIQSIIDSAIASEATAAALHNNSEVRIWVDGDDDANRVSAVLEALGYTVLRELEQGDGPTRLRWAVSRLVRRHKLTGREQEILERVLAGRHNLEIAGDLEISRATVKWHMHNIFAKTNTGQRESLLRLALQLGGARPAKDSAANVTAPSDEDAPATRQSELLTEPHKVAHEIMPAESVPSKAWF
jgi:DNA-binding CsgD family transcriptional regulator